MLAAAASANIVYGHSAPLTTTLTDTTSHTTIAGATVTLVSRAGTRGAFHSLATRASRRPNGHRTTGFVLSLTLHAKGAHLLRVSRPATSTNTAGRSRQLTLHVT